MVKIETKVRSIGITRACIVLDKSVRKLCKLPYPGHKNGCPNYNKNPLCPPKSNFGLERIDKYGHFKLFVAEGDFKAYMEDMKDEHPTWSDRQVRNPIYWQHQMRKYLSAAVKLYLRKMYPVFTIFWCGSGFNYRGEDCQSMESAGINVFATCKCAGVTLEKRPVNTVRLVALVCHYGERNPLEWKPLAKR